jgi:hypothetical protein
MDPLVISTVSFNSYMVWDDLFGNVGQLPRMLRFIQNLPHDTDFVTVQEMWCSDQNHLFCQKSLEQDVIASMHAAGLPHHSSIGMPAPKYRSRNLWWMQQIGKQYRKGLLPLMIVLPILSFALFGLCMSIIMEEQLVLSGGLAFFCRHPLLHVEAHPWDTMDKVHFPENLAAKGFQWVRFCKQGVPISVVNLHLCMACSPAIARKQLRQLWSFVEKQVPREDVLFIQGDFNLEPKMFMDLFPGMTLAIEDRRCTWRDTDLSRCRHYDHILFRGGVLQSCGTVRQEEYMSDHVPITATVQLTPSPSPSNGTQWPSLRPSS